MIRLLLFVLVTTLTAGCKEDEPAAEAPKLEYIAKALSIEGTDTTRVSFEYNKKNQLSKIVSSPEIYSKLEYYESGELAICDSYFSWPLDPSFKVREYLTLTYNDKNELVSGVMKRYVNNIFADKINYTYVLNDKKQVVEVVTDNAEKPGELITYDEEGNIASIETMGDTEAYTYNDKKSYLANSRLKYYFGADFLPVDLFNKNDITKVVYSTFSLDEEQVTSEYNESSLPISSAVSINSSGDIKEEKRVYEYVLR